MPHRLVQFVVCLVVGLLRLTSARADDADIWVLPTELRPTGAAPAPVELELVARQLDAVLQEAVRDFGLTPLLGDPRLPRREAAALTELAREAAVLAPELGLDGADLELKLSLVPRGSEVLLMRVQRVELAELDVRSLGMLRDLLEPARRVREDCPETPGVLPAESQRPSARSEGRVVLALHAAALGGWLGSSLQRASGSDDARLTYPLAALGAAVGVGSAVIVSEEWDIDVARAWFLGGAMFWPGVATLLLVEGDGPDSPGRRHLLGILGAVGGVTLATAGLALGDVTEGGAALTHSGAGLGLLLGGLGEMLIDGDAERTPRRGMGVGALAGVLAAGALATRIEGPSPSDMLAIDLSALLGGLTGAALGTPVLVSQEASPTRDRIWLSGILTGTLAGAALGYVITGGSSELAAPAGGGELRVSPQLGWAGTPLGFGLTGSW